MRALVVLAALLAPLPAAAATVRGLVVDRATREPVAGATVVISSAEASTAAITDEDGRYSVDVVPGAKLLTVFYGERTIERQLGLTRDGEVVTIAIDTSVSNADWGCDFGPPPLYDGEPWTHATLDLGDRPLVWRRDHRGLDDLDARLDPATAVAVVDRAHRLPGAPAIALELLDERTAYAGFAPLRDPIGAGGTDELVLTHGSNEVALDARLALARRGRLAARASGPLHEDHAWASTGVVLDQTAAGLGVQALATGDAAWSPERQLQVSGLVTRTADGHRDDWAAATLVDKADDNRREVEVGVVGERLDDVDRLGGRLIVRQRGKLGGGFLRGYHDVVIGGEVGGGHAGDAIHTDAAGFVGERWDPRPNLTLDGGVRWERRTVGGAATEAWLPRLAVAYDPSEEGRVLWFAGAERGDRAAGTTAVAGVARDWGALRWSAAVRARQRHRERALGGELTARWPVADRRWAVEATASSLEEVATARASYTSSGVHTYQLAAIGRATRTALGWGVRVETASRGFPAHDLVTAIAIEALDLDDRDLRSAHLVLALRPR